MAGFFPPVTLLPKNLAGFSFSCALQTRERFLLRWPSDERKGFSGRTPQAAVCECQQLEVEARSPKIEERAAGDRHVGHDEVTDKNKKVLSNLVPTVNADSSSGLGFKKTSV